MSESPPRPASLALLDWRPLQRNTLRGFASVRLPGGLAISDISVHHANGRTWASLPSKPMLDRDGVAVRDPATAKIRYQPFLSWPDRITADRFSAAVAAAVEARHPGALTLPADAA